MQPTESVWPVIRALFVRRVTGQYLWYHHGRNGPPAELSPGWHLVAPDWNRDAYIYAAAPLHLMLKLWHWRYEPLRWACRAGFLAVEEGGLLTRGQWTWRWWNTLRFERERMIRFASQHYFLRGIQEGRGQIIEELRASLDEEREDDTPSHEW